MKLSNLDKVVPPALGNMAKKKQEKKNAIINSAFDLFVNKGISRTSIDDIVKGASLAKGTFYLYFKDKEGLLDEMVYMLCFEAVGEALRLLDEEHKKNAEMEIGDSVCYFTEKLLELLLENKEMMPIIHKNLSKGLYEFNSEDKELFNSSGENNIIRKVIKNFENKFLALGGTEKEARKRFYMIVEIANSVSYNAITEGKPYSFNEVKPILMKTIRSLAYPDFI